MRVECQTCHGTYETTCADGTIYFHACPPLAAWEIRALIDAGRSPLTKRQAAELAAREQRADEQEPVELGAARGNDYLAQLGLPRPNARNENIDLGKVADAKKDPQGNVHRDVAAESLMVSVGAGVREVVDADDAE